MNVEYSAFRRSKVTLAQLPARHFDLFLSSFNSSKRVNIVAEAINASRKVWIVHGEYAYSDSELPDTETHLADAGLAPAQSWEEMLREASDGNGLSGMSVAVDITGMMRPHVAMLPFALKRAGAQEVAVYYSDPESYVKGEQTPFTKGPVTHVSLIPGMEGSHSNRPSPRDALIVGAGYDHALVKAVVDDKPNAEHVILLGLPSLQPHMYQESVLKLDRARESIRDFRPTSRAFAPANNPFATAQVIANKIDELGDLDHVYLTAVGTKPQVLGFAWYYWCQAAGDNASFVFPYADRYERDTSNGIAAIHEYVLELDYVRELERPPSRY